MNFNEIKTYQDVCNVLNIDSNTLPDVSCYDNEDKQAAISEFKLWKVSKAAWKLANKKQDWRRGNNQPKYSGWFWMADQAGSGSGFSFGGFLYGFDGSVVGSRRVFPSRGDFQHAVKVFPELFKDTMTIPEI
jgi:hypothetical protein